jgi:hypothetical protein
MTGAWLTLKATVGALPGVTNAVLGVKSSGVNTGILIGAGISAMLYPLIGLLSQRFGRRPTIAVIGLLNLIPACALYYVLVASGYRDPTTLIILVALIMVLSLPIWAVHTPYLAESFRTGIRIVLLALGGLFFEHRCPGRPGNQGCGFPPAGRARDGLTGLRCAARRPLG